MIICLILVAGFFMPSFSKFYYTCDTCSCDHLVQLSRGDEGYSWRKFELSEMFFVSSLTLGKLSHG